MEEKLYTASDMTALATELTHQIKTLQERNANLALSLSQANAQIRHLDNSIKDQVKIKK